MGDGLWVKKMETLAERLISFRAGRWLTQEDFGKMVGASKAAVSRWEAGVSVPRAATMVRIESVIKDEKGQKNEAGLVEYKRCREKWAQ